MKRLVFSFISAVNIILSMLRRSSTCRKAVLLSVVVVLVAFSGIGAWKLVTLGYITAEDKIVQLLDWRVEHIEVQMVEKNTVDVSETISRSGLYEGAYINDVNWSSLVNGLMQNPLVADAKIIRPSAEKVIVFIKPSKIIARVSEQKWGVSGKSLDVQQSVLIDGRGQKIRVTPRLDDEKLIGISGRMVMNNVDDFWGLLMAEPTMARMTSKVEFIGKRRWDVTLNNGVKIKLPEAETGLALRRLSKLIEQKGIDIDTVKVIDLRTNDRAFVEYVDGKEHNHAS